MSQLWTEVASWWLRLAFAGGAVLLAGLLVVVVCRQPVRRLRIGSWSLSIALLVLPMTLLPGWFALPWELQAEKPVAEQSDYVAASLRDARPVAEQPGDVVSSLRDALPVAEQPGYVAGPIAEQPDCAVRLGSISGVNDTQMSGHRLKLAWTFNILLLAYASVVMMMILRLAVGQLRLEQLWYSGQAAPRNVRNVLRAVTESCRCRPQLRVSESVASPICFGIFRPRIVLPVSMVVSDEQSLRWIFAHEMSHMERRDPLVGWLIGVVQSLFFFCPWFWKLRREVRLNQEILADAAAVKCSTHSENNRGVLAVDYADFLVRLVGASLIPAAAAGVKTKSSDLYRRVAMLLHRSGNIESKCPRRWSLLAGGVLLLLGFSLAGFHLVNNDLKAAAEPDKKAEPAEPKKSIEDIEKEIQKGLESLKKGAEPKKEDRAADLNPIDAMRKADEALKKAQQALRDNPKSDEARKAFEEATRKYQEAMKNNLRAGPPAFAPFQPINPEDFEKEVQRMLDEMQRQMQFQPGVFPGGGRVIIGGGLRPPFRTIGDARLGVRLDKPTAALVEQLDLPADKGLVVMQVMPDSAAAKAGIKANDILLEMGGKAVPSDVVELQRMLRDFKADEKMDVVVMRKGKKETLKDIKLPEARPEAANPFQGLPRVPNLRLPNGFPPEFFNGPNNGQGGVRSSIQVTNGEFTAKHSENGMDITVVGVKDDGGPVVTSIQIEDGGKSIKATSIDKLDEKYRPMVEKILKRIR